ncbi:dihydroorotase [Chitinasiproducens palmae]|uniref:Dihydroorotase n=1 Tax=Chitinasiproducens palmae TaxID=1770053 RepID=A0A1H2PMQ9_9BURK|nr:dihydroorotase [Chitinasiproducens palmae]SDV47849.1 dihydroorotase [Chitinasiproducens palmae]
MKIHIKGGRLLDPVAGSASQTDLYIAHGKIVARGDAPADFTVERTIDAAGLSVAPGLVDVCARLREPGNEHRATLHSEMAAAAAGGITSVVCPPDTDPPLDEPGLIDMLQFRARKLNGPRIYPLGALTVGLGGRVITEMVQLRDSGCVGFSQADQPLTDSKSLLRAMQYAKTHGFTVWLRPMDAALSADGVAASGAFASRLGLSGVPVAAETIALHTIFELMRTTGVSVHLSHVSSAAGIALVREAKAEGLPVTCDVTANHVHLCDVDIGYFDAQYRLDPPLRQVRDRDAIRDGLADGTIDVVCSDHTPLDDDHKLLPFAEASPGATGVELLLSLIVKWAQEAKLPLERALKPVTINAARLIGLAENACSVGGRADLCIFDPSAYWHVEPSRLVSQGHNTPFAGYELPGRVVATLVDGRIAYERT